MNLVFVFAVATATSAAAAPSVFVPEQSNLAWYITKAQARPMGKALNRVSLAALNKYREQNWPVFQPLCYVEPLTKSSFIGLRRNTQLDIEATFKSVKHDPFVQQFTTSDGRRFTALVGLGEECQTGTIVSTIVVQDAQSGAIENVLEWSETPFRFLWPGQSGALIYHSSCFECGDSNGLYYDAGRRRFYWESEGD